MERKDLDRGRCHLTDRISTTSRKYHSGVRTSVTCVDQIVHAGAQPVRQGYTTSQCVWRVCVSNAGKWPYSSRPGNSMPTARCMTNYFAALRCTACIRATVDAQVQRA